jgi:hypothetical protein
MSERKYLIYLDILGFEPLAKDIAVKKGIEERDVRRKFISVIKEKVRALEAEGKIEGKKYGDSDDWLLVTDTMDKVFKSIFEILDHNTGYKNYEEVPLEIAIGVGDYDKWAKFDGVNLVIEDQTIAFIKTNIMGHYHKWHKKRHGGASVKSTFVVLTESTYQRLELPDMKMCQGIECKVGRAREKPGIITFFVADVEKIRQRGKVFSFLEKVGYGDSKWYARIDELYVAPIEYEDIKKLLKNKRIVLITGTPEYGKTYTAVRLMWEYYNAGYEPIWLKGGEQIERNRVRETLENVRAQLKPRRIIYFEDPFGKVMYEKRETLEREIGIVIDSVQQVADCFIILTSREEVFKEFEKEKISSKDLRAFEIRLNIKKPSYDYDRRREVLLKWAEEENCKWLNDKELKELVLRALKIGEVLPTPLSIREFAVATANSDNTNELVEQMLEKSEETAKVFAKEIQNMTYDKILFLSFPLVSSHFKVEFVRDVYQEMMKELNLKDAWEFERVLQWFKDDKINISDGYIQFAHPSYSESLKYLLSADGHAVDINNKIVNTLLRKLIGECEFAVDTNVVKDVSMVIVVNSDKFPEDLIRDLLLKLSKKNDEAAEFIAFISVKYSAGLDWNFVRNLLLKLSEKSDDVATFIALILVKYFGSLPKDSVRDLLLKVFERETVAKRMTPALIDDFGSLPEDFVRDLLLELSKKESVANHVALVLIDKFGKVPEDFVRDLLLELSKKESVAKYVVLVLIDKFGKVPEAFIRDLLLELSRNKAFVPYLALVLVEYSGSLPGNFVRDLLLELTEKAEGEEGRSFIAKLVKDRSDKISDSLKNELLLKCSWKDKAT